MAALDAIPFRGLLWLVPVFFTLHNIEEAPFMAKWSKRLPVKFHSSLTTPQFVVAVTFLTLVSYILTYASLAWLPASPGYLIILGMQMILFVNAFVPHLATTIRFRLYSPGVVTAVLITVPFSVYLFQRAFAAGILNWGQFWLLLGIAPFAMITLTVLSLQLGKVVTRKPNFSG
jgi:hypothetical protein